jgi:hypothetical protein
MRLAGLLIGPAVLAFLIATALSTILSEPSSEPQPQAAELLWDGTVFTTRAEFAEWLEDRDLSIQEWERRHPSSPWATASPSAGEDVAAQADEGSNWLVLGLGGALVLIVGLSAAAVLLLRRSEVTLHRPHLARPAEPMSENGARPTAAKRQQLAVASLAVRRGVEAVQPRVHDAALAARRGVEAVQPRVNGAALAARRGVEAVQPRVHGAALAARRRVEVAKPRLESAGLTARQRIGAVAAQTVELGLELRYALATGRFRVALFYVVAALCSAAIGLWVAIAA